MNLYVGNLSRTVTEADLEVIFEGLGHVVFTRLVQGDEDSNVRGYAFVAVRSEKQAQHVISGMDGKYLKGLRLIVRPVLDRARQARAVRAQSARLPQIDRLATPLRLLKGGQATD